MKDFVASYASCKILAQEANNYIEKNKVDKLPDSFIEPLKKSFADILEFSQLQFTVDPKESVLFYEYLFLNIEKEISFDIRGLFDIKITKTETILKCNPLFCKDYSIPEFWGALIKELAIIPFDVPETYSDMNPNRSQNMHDLLEKGSNVMRDSIIRSDIQSSIKNNSGKMLLKLPKDSASTADLENELGIVPQEKQSLEYYTQLIAKFGKKDPGSSQTSGDSSMQQSTNQNNMIASPNNSAGNQVHDFESVDKEDAKNAAKELVSKVFDNMTESQRGLIPGNLLAAINQLLAPPQINWREQFKRLVETLPLGKRKNRMVPNRREEERLDLYGKKTDYTTDIVCGIDTSGSVSDKAISFFLNEILAMLKDRPARITIIECDATIGNVYQIKKPSDIHYKVSGRGGTYFTPVIEYINSHNFREALFIMFTDGYGETEIPKPLTKKNMWVVLDDVKNLSVSNPYGIVKSLSEDKKWRSNNG